MTTVLPPLLAPRSPLLFLAFHGDFESGQGAAGVAVAGFGPVVERVLVELDVELAVAAFGVFERVSHHALDGVFVQRFEAEDLGAADQGGIDSEEGVFCRGADEGDDALLDVAEEHVLLGLVEAVDFVEEEDGAPAVVFEPASCVVEHVADVLDADGGGIAPFEGLVGGLGDDLGEGGFCPFRAGRRTGRWSGRRRRACVGASGLRRGSAPGRRTRRASAAACGRPAAERRHGVFLSGPARGRASFDRSRGEAHGWNPWASGR